jgi:hypothetical protein
MKTNFASPVFLNSWSVFCESVCKFCHFCSVFCELCPNIWVFCSVFLWVLLYEFCSYVRLFFPMHSYVICTVLFILILISFLRALRLRVLCLVLNSLRLASVTWRQPPLINKVKCNCSTPPPLIYIPAKSN